MHAADLEIEIKKEQGGKKTMISKEQFLELKHLRTAPAKPKRSTVTYWIAR